MKRLIIVLIGICLMFLSGCGTYNLSFFTIPDDTKFLETIEKLSTPPKISDYMIENFTYRANPISAISPYTLYKTKLGDCNDFATFATFIANYHNYETYQLGIYYKNFKHRIAIYREGNYSITNNQYYSFGYDTFLEIVEYDSNLRDIIWSKFTVYDYDNNIVETGYNN